MKTAIVRVFTFDVECPECGELIESSEGAGSLTWSIHESVPRIVRCQNCFAISKVPKKVKGSALEVAS